VTRVLAIAFPLFAIIGVGFVAYRRRIVSEETPSALLSFVYYFLLPPFVLLKIASADFSRGVPIPELLSYYISAAIVFSSTYIIGRWIRRQDRKTLAIRSLASIASNTGYLGLPVVVLAYGEAAVLPAIAMVLGDSMIVLVGGSLLLEGDGTAVLASLGRLARNPLIAATVLGTLYVLIVGVIPGPIRALGQMLADATLPCALFALGATVAQHRSAGGTPGGANDRYELVAQKVIVFPVIAMVLAHWVFGLDRTHTGIVAVLASMPVSITAFIIASRYEVQVGEMSSVLLLTTALSVLGLSGLLLMFS
jgi:malonate transporter